MKNKPYQFISHTADLGIRVNAKSLKDLFKNTATAVFDIIAERQEKEGPPNRLEISQKAEDKEELFVNWLNELLSLSSAKNLIFTDFNINKLDDRFLQAVVSGHDSKHYKIHKEIKAATFHDLKIIKSGFGWVAEVIFDV